jgi:alkanesulfonate monooxygenase SsuD/methylene tetrahydromethanopterin reductase-like flavin-dependent oxidoreductase (luciferase family)
MIGGNGPKRTLPLAARYANIWNGTFLSPDTFRERSAILDDLVQKAGRNPGDVRRTMMHTLHFGRDMAELDRRLSWRHNNPEFAGKPLETVIESMQSSWSAIAGTPDMVIRQIQTYAQAGVEELMLQWFDLDDIDGLRTFATSVVPYV